MAIVALRVFGPSLFSCRIFGCGLSRPSGVDSLASASIDLAEGVANRRSVRSTPMCTHGVNCGGALRKRHGCDDCPAMSALSVAIRRGRSDLCAASPRWSRRTRGFLRETVLGPAETRGRWVVAASARRLHGCIIGIHAVWLLRFMRRVHIGIGHGSTSL